MLHDAGQHQGEHQRGDRDLDLVEDITQHPEKQNQVKLDHAAIDGKSAQHGNGDDQRVKNAAGNVEQAHENADQRQIQNQQHHVADVHAVNQTPDQVRTVLEQQWPGLNAVHDESAHHDRCGAAAGHAQGEQRHHGAGRVGVVGGLGAGHAFNGALTEFFGIFGQPLFGRVRQQRGDGAAGTRQDAD